MSQFTTVRSYMRACGGVQLIVRCAEGSTPRQLKKWLDGDAEIVDVRRNDAGHIYAAVNTSIDTALHVGLPMRA